MHDPACALHSGTGMTTEELLAELRTSPTDLARFVEAAARSQRSEVLVATRTLTAWRQRDPQGWAKVIAWLADNRKKIREV
jgi:hypothetical protein